MKNFISPVYGGEASTVTAFFPIIIFVLSVILYRSKQKVILQDLIFLPLAC
ncbi:hypothetical protein QUB72_04720 [Enterococcus faecium]|nr:hypothetical protein [Enterococcus faecium]